MNRLKDAALVALVAALILQYWLDARRFDEAGRWTAVLEKRNGSLEAAVRQMTRERDAANGRAAAAAAAASEIAAPSPASTEPLDSMELRMAAILDRTRRMRAWLAQHPEQRIAEFASMSDDQWMDAVRRFAALDSDVDFRKAAAQLRFAAEVSFLTGPAGVALKAYLATSGNVLPTDVSQLGPYLDSSQDPTALQHYVMIASGPYKQGPVYALNLATATVDPAYDRSMVAAQPNGSQTMSGVADPSFELERIQAQSAYRQANNGNNPTTAAQLVPYFTNPQSGARYLQQNQKAH